METRKILILRGLQGSGKTTYARQWISNDPENRIRFNRDDIRNMLGTYWMPNREGLITEMFWDFMILATNAGKDIVIDNMNLNEKYIKEIEKWVEETNEFFRFSECPYHYEIEIKDFFNVSLETCIERDSKRENPIGEKVIRQTYNRYKDKITPWKYLQ